MKEIFFKNKLIFYFLNIFIFLEYLYPGSLLGCIIFKNCKIQPQLTPNFIISSNHFYSFIILSIVGFLTFKKDHQQLFLIIYLIFISIILEVIQYFIPGRSFEYPDLFGNLTGVIVVLVIAQILKK
tara:strand:- start:405 stop:782 length:378 start_codon:yes stop_codon:yes gene_type:complete